MRVSISTVLSLSRYWLVIALLRFHGSRFSVLSIRHNLKSDGPLAHKIILPISHYGPWVFGLQVVLEMYQLKYTTL